MPGASECAHIETPARGGIRASVRREAARDDTNIGQIPLAVNYDDIISSAPDAYETLLADVIEGDQTLFVRADEVEASWSLYEPLLDRTDIDPYAAGTDGPESAKRLVTTYPGVWSVV